MHLFEERATEAAPLSEPHTLAVELELGPGVVAANGVDDGRGREPAAQRTRDASAAQPDAKRPQQHVAVPSLGVAADQVAAGGAVVGAGELWRAPDTGKGVAVGGEAAAERRRDVRQGAVPVTGQEEQTQRVEGPRREHHPRSLGRTLAPCLAVVVGDAVLPVPGLEAGDFGENPELGSVPQSQRNVREVHGRLRASRASQDALPQVGAGLLLDPDRVAHLLRPVRALAEHHAEVGVVHVAEPALRSDSLENDLLLRQLRQRLRPQDRTNPLEVARHLRARDLIRIGVEELVLRTDEQDVDERAPTDAADRERVQASEAVDLEQAFRVEHELATPPGAREADAPHVAQHSDRSARKGASGMRGAGVLVARRSPPYTPLEDEDPRSLLGKPGGHHRTGEARPDDDDVVIHAWSPITSLQPSLGSA